MLPDAARQAAQKAFDRAFDSAAEVLVADHSELRQQESENARVLNTRGDLPEALAQQYEGRRKQYEALHRWAGAGLAWRGRAVLAGSAAGGAAQSGRGLLGAGLAGLAGLACSRWPSSC